MKSLVLAALFSSWASAAPLSCVAAGTPAVVRWESLSERIGDIVLNCTGGTPGSSLTGNLAVFLPAAVTNKLSSNATLDAFLTVDTGAGQVASGVAAGLQGGAGVAFNGLNVAVPPSGQLALRVSNIRINANSLPSTNMQPVTALIAFSGSSLSLANTQVPVAVPVRGLLAFQAATQIDCTGSPLPDNVGFAALINKGTRSSTVRVTEGSAGSFEPKTPLADTGTRIMLRYAGVPKTARIFVPDFVAGSTAVVPTSVGDLGFGTSGGVYAAGARGALLLGRVSGADANGAGGRAVPSGVPLSAGQVMFDTLSELPLTNGSGTLVYEVLDADPNTVETAQIPTFIGIPPVTDTSNVTPATVSLSLAPVSADATASQSPVPRFAAVDPPPDCSALGDCKADYFPRLLVDPVTPITMNAAANAPYQIRYIRVVNEGGGLMYWSATASYKNGSNWLRLDPPSGNNGATLRIDIVPAGLAPGIYEAAVTVNAGAAVGSRTIPVTLTITAAPSAPPVQPPAQPPAVTPPKPAVDSVSNAAGFSASGVVAGSIATLKGSRLGGQVVLVTFDTFDAQILYKSDTQINVVVPAGLAGRPSAKLTVTVDGNAGSETAVPLAPTAPAIFDNGILNEDNSPNTAAVPAAAGSVVQIFLTGLALPPGYRATAHLHDIDVDALVYAGPAPGLPGVQQVNLRIPDYMPAMTTTVLVCAANGSGRVCSAPAKITFRR